MAYEEDRLGFLLGLRERYGAVVAFDDRTTIVNDVDLAHEVLADRQRAFAILGNFRAERVTAHQAGAAVEARAAMGPGLRPAAITHLGPQTSRLIEQAFSGAATGASATLDPIPLLEDVLTRVTYEHYFGADWSTVRPVVGRLLTCLAAVFGSPFALPSFIPTPSRLRIRLAYRAARAAVDPLIETRRRTREADDYVAQLVRTKQLVGASPARVADLVIGSLLAAHRIPALGVAWALLELSHQPRVQHDLAVRSLERESPDAPPPLALATILEAVRLHPPTWILNRTVTRPAVLGQYEFAPGDQLIISPYVIHRDPTVFERPLDFDADRWSQTTATRGFLGFGRGLNICPGQHLGLVTMTYALTAIVRRWRIEPDPADSTALLEDPRSSLVPVHPAIRLEPRRHREPVDATSPSGSVVQAVDRPLTSSTRWENLSQTACLDTPSDFPI